MSKRMRIEDFELMIEARRRYLAADVDHSSEAESHDGGHRETLEASKKLEGPLFMDWEPDAHLDAALRAALRFLAERLPKDPPPPRLEPADVEDFLSQRLRAIEELIAKLGSS